MDVRAAIATATLNSPKGSLNGPRQGYVIENNDQLSDHPGAMDRR